MKVTCNVDTPTAKEGDLFVSPYDDDIVFILIRGYNSTGSRYFMTIRLDTPRRWWASGYTIEQAIAGLQRLPPGASVTLTQE